MSREQEQVQQQEQEQTQQQEQEQEVSYESLSNRIDGLIQRITEGQHPEEPEDKLKALNDQVDKLESIIAKMVQNGSYLPNNQVPDPEKQQEAQTQASLYEPDLGRVEIFNSLRDMDFNMKDDDINQKGF